MMVGGGGAGHKGTTRAQGHKGTRAQGHKGHWKGSVVHGVCVGLRGVRGGGWGMLCYGGAATTP